MERIDSIWAVFGANFSAIDSPVHKNEAGGYFSVTAEEGSCGRALLMKHSLENCSYFHSAVKFGW